MDPYPAPPALVLHSIEAACLDDLLFDPEANYAQVLEEARIHASKQAPAKRPISISQEQPSRRNAKGRSCYNQRTAKVYFVPPPILDDDDDEHTNASAAKSSKNKSKKKKRKPWSSWMDPLLDLWRGSGHRSAAADSTAAHNVPKKPRAGSASGPLPLYTDGNGQDPRPWHRHWSSSASGGGFERSGGLAAISCAGGAAGHDAASPYVQLRPPHDRTPGPHPRKWTSGPLYVTS